MDSNKYDKDLVQVRRILELAAVEMSAERRTLEDLQAIKVAQQAFADQTLNYESGIEENILFHLKVISASKNDVLKSLFMKIIPDILSMFNKSKYKDNVKYLRSIAEHDLIIDHIMHQDGIEAKKAMDVHLTNENL